MIVNALIDIYLGASMMSQLADENLYRYEKEFDGVQDVFELQVYTKPPFCSIDPISTGI